MQGKPNHEYEHDVPNKQDKPGIQYRQDKQNGQCLQ